MDLMRADNSLTYCEGYALFESGVIPTIHAWVTDGEGLAIDNTWPKAGVAYAGVPFKSDFVKKTRIKNLANISLLDDGANGWPLLRGLGDSPDEWLALQGGVMQRIRNVRETEATD